MWWCSIFFHFLAWISRDWINDSTGFTSQSFLSVNRALKAMKAQTQRETHGPENSSYATLEIVPTVMYSTHFLSVGCWKTCHANTSWGNVRHTLSLAGRAYKSSGLGSAFSSLSNQKEYEEGGIRRCLNERLLLRLLRPRTLRVLIWKWASAASHKNPHRVVYIE